MNTMRDNHGRTVAEVLALNTEVEDRISPHYVACRDPECKAWTLSDGVWYKHYHQEHWTTD